MQPITWFKAPQPQLSDFRRIAAAFGGFCEGERIELGGMPNRSFRFRRGDRDCVGRVCNTDYTEPEHLRFEVSVLLHLEKASTIGVPRLIRATDGNYIHFDRLGPTIAMTMLPGSELQSVTRFVAGSLGRRVAQVSNDLAQYASPANWGPSCFFNERNDRMSDRLLKCGMPDGWPVSAKWISEAFETFYGRLAASSQRPLRPCHTDYWPPNILVENDDVSVIDFDDVAFGPSDLDIASAVAEVALGDDDTINRELARDLLSPSALLEGSERVDSAQRLVNAIGSCLTSWMLIEAGHNRDFSHSADYCRWVDMLLEPSRCEALTRKFDDILNDHGG